MATDVRGDHAPISREILEDRWNGLVTAPCRPGQRTKLWRRLSEVLADLTNGVTRRDLDHGDDGSGDDIYVITDQLEEILRQAIVRIVDERGLARTGWEALTGSAPEPVR